MILGTVKQVNKHGQPLCYGDRIYLENVRFAGQRLSKDSRLLQGKWITILVGGDYLENDGLLMVRYQILRSMAFCAVIGSPISIPTPCCSLTRSATTVLSNVRSKGIP